MAATRRRSETSQDPAQPFLQLDLRLPAELTLGPADVEELRRTSPGRSGAKSGAGIAPPDTSSSAAIRSRTAVSRRSRC